jgi:hypothetical protein
MKTIIKQKQIQQPSNGCCSDVRPEPGTNVRMKSVFYNYQTSGARGVPV